MMEFGKGETFRRAGWLERAGAAFRRPLANSSLKAPLKRLYEAVLDRAPGDRLACRFPGGEVVRLAAAFRQVVWNAEEYGAFRQHIADGDVVFDVGANLGGYTMLFGMWVGPRGKVYGFEPAPGARRGLTRHVMLNHLEDRIVVRPEAMSIRDGTTRFRAAGLDGDNRIAHGAEQGIDVATTSLDTFCRAHHLHPSFIKLDVEGAELDVLKGARETLLAVGRGLALYVEMHPHLWAGFGYGRADLERELARQGLGVERIDGHPDPWTIAGVCLRVTRCGS
ncbi:MAG: FkbM family methyltransferase [Acidobacteriota bacterium]